MKNQRIEQITANPNRSGNLLSGIKTPDLTKKVPDNSGAIIGQGVGGALQSLGKNMMDYAEKRIELDNKIQAQANENGMNEFIVQANGVLQRYQPQLDSEKGKLAIEKSKFEMSNFLSKIEGLDKEGKEAIQERMKLYDLRLENAQKYGRMKMVEERGLAQDKTHLDMAIKDGDLATATAYYDKLEKKNVRLNQTLPEIKSKVVLHKNIINQIGGMSNDYLKVLDDDLNEVNKDGSSKKFTGMSREDTLLAKREVKSAIARNQTEAREELKEYVRKEELTEEKLQELFSKGNLSLDVYRSYRADFQKARDNFLKNQVKQREAKDKVIAGKLYYDITMMKFSDNPAERRQQANKLKERIHSEGSLDFKTKAVYEEKLDKKLSSYNKASKEKHYTSHPLYKLAMDLIDSKKSIKLYSDPDGLFNKDDSTENAVVQKARLMRRTGDWIEMNLGKISDDDVKNYINNRIKEINEAKVIYRYEEKYKKPKKLFKEKQKTPSAGFEKGGYRFKGGNPAKAVNWEKIK